MGEPSNEILLTVPEAQLHEVNNGKERLLEWGELQISLHSLGEVTGLWVRVGKTEWSIDSTSPTLKATEHTFMFAMGGGRFYSVLLAKGTPPDAEATLEEILMECTAFEVAGAMSKQAQEEAITEVAEDVANDEDLPLAIARPQTQPGVKPTTSERIMSGAATVQDKLMASANWASQKVLESGKALQAKTQPADKPVDVNPRVASSIKVARRVAEKGNWAANKVAGGLADISVKLADSIVKRMGPNNKYGQQLNDPDTRPSASREVAAAAVVAAVGIFDSMDQAARVVLNSGGQATSDFIGHKYGSQAKEVAHDAASASITSGMTVMTVRKIGMRKIAKRIAKRTAVGLVKSYTVGPNHSGSAASSKTQQALPGPAAAAPGKLAAAQPVAAAPGVQQTTANLSQPPQVPAGQPHRAPAGQPQPVAAPLQVTQTAPITEAAPGPIEYRSPFAN